MRLFGSLLIYCKIKILRGGAVAARQSHNLQVAGSIPARATYETKNTN